MKYVRKVMALGLAIVFLIALVIGTGIILSVRNVNVTYLEYPGEYSETYAAIRTEEYGKTRAALNKLKGSGLLFIGEAEIKEKISSPNQIALVSYEKKFPCTVDIVLRERLETFAVKTDAGYAVYDEKGEFLRNVSDENSDEINAIDGCPDVIMEVQPAEITAVAQAGEYFKANFGSLRRLVKSVTTRKLLELKVATFNLRSGLSVAISDWENNTERKIKKAYETYLQLSDGERAKGIITVAEGKDGTGPVSRYSAQ